VLSLRPTPDDARQRLIEANRQLALALEESRAAAFEAAMDSSAKTEFLANMTHEIRTPTNGIVGMAALLMGTDLSPEQRDYAHTLATCADRLMGIINDVADFTHLEAGRVELQPTSIDPVALAGDVAGELAAKADRRKVEVVLSAAADAPRAILGDAVRLRQILAQLITNAVRYTDRGQIAVEVGGGVPPADGLRLAVTDTGIGMSPERVARLFDSAAQPDGAPSRRQVGVGLGLTIVKRLVDLMAGHIEVSSELGVGSRFTVHLPLPSPAQPPPEERPEFPELGRVLVVDDHDAARAALADVLTAWDIVVDQAADMPGALSLLGRASRSGAGYGLLLVDLRLRDQDGRALIRRLRANARLRPLPVVALVPPGECDRAAELASLGVVGWLPKPVRPGPLEALLHEVCDQRSPRPPANTDLRGLVGLRVLLAEDSLVNQKVATRMLEGLGCTVELARDGREALRRTEDSSFDVVLMDCHMPVMDGFEATLRIREAEANGRHLPIIAVTATTLARDRDRCLAVGMDDFLSKPICYADLSDMLTRWAPRPAAD